MRGVAPVVVAVIALVVGLVIGAGVTILAAPAPTPQTVTRTVTQTVPTTITVTAPAEPGMAVTVTQTVTRTVTQPPVTVTQTVTQTVEAPGLSGVILIGGLLSLSGPLETFGQNHKAAMELAAMEVNEYYSLLGVPATIELRIEDTEVKPDVALEKIQALHAAGVRFFVGPLSSGELSRIKEYADANQLLVISQSSTAPALAIPGDFIFRFTPDDTKQGPAIARLIYDSGVRRLVIVYRQDTWGEGLQKAVREAFERLGGVVEEVIGYPRDATEFSAEISALNSKIEELINQYGADQVGVELIAFEEVVTIFQTANEYPALKQVKWFGSDGTAKSGKIVEDPVAREFASSIEFYNTIFAPASSPKNERVRRYIEETFGRVPDSYTYSAYDAVWVIALSMLQVGSPDPVKVRDVLARVAEQYFGATGWIKLNEAGDLEVANYEIWAVKLMGGEYEWQHVATYIGAADSINWIG